MNNSLLKTYAKTPVKSEIFQLRALKITLDDVLKRYLTTVLGWKQCHTISDIRIFVGLVSIVSAAITLYLSLNVDFSVYKPFVVVLLSVYFALNVLLEIFLFIFPEPVFKGEKNGSVIVVKSDVKEPHPIYTLAIFRNGESVPVKYAKSVYVVPLAMRDRRTKGEAVSARPKDVASDTESDEELYIDSSDEERLKSMSEIQRQKILYERHAKLRAYKEKREIERRLRELSESRAAPSESEKTESASEFRCSDLALCVLPRDFLLENANKTYFEKFVGHLVKVKIRETYKIARIVGIGCGEVYTVKVGKRNISTTRALELVAGRDSQRKMSIQFVSNAPVEEEEFETFKAENGDFDLASHEEKVRSLKKYVQRHFGEVETLSERGLQSGRKRNTLLKIDLIKKREGALEMKKYDQASKIQEQIDQLTTSESREQDIWAVISERNRKINADIARMLSERPVQSADEDESSDPCKRKRTRGGYE
ncbi:UNVERIFIED_CONTAM: hypothetical protein PYX00_011407 [Menopon gallinae]|uniref:Signal peptidase complex subunit 2 n=1 Tax=Menopon gallinae TaxID=328185 RepID=A0AAW2H7H6_9NEOP